MDKSRERNNWRTERARGTSILYLDTDAERTESAVQELERVGYDVEVAGADSGSAPPRLELMEHDLVVVEARGEMVTLAEAIVDTLGGPGTEQILPVILLVDRECPTPFRGADRLPALRVPFSDMSLSRLIELQLEWAVDTQPTTLFQRELHAMPSIERAGETTPPPEETSRSIDVVPPRRSSPHGWRRRSMLVIAASAVSLLALGIGSMSDSTDQAPPVRRSN